MPLVNRGNLARPRLIAELYASDLRGYSWFYDDFNCYALDSSIWDISTGGTGSYDLDTIYSCVTLKSSASGDNITISSQQLRFGVGYRKNNKMRFSFLVKCDTDMRKGFIELGTGICSITIGECITGEGTKYGALLSDFLGNEIFYDCLDNLYKLDWSYFDVICTLKRVYNDGWKNLFIFKFFHDGNKVGTTYSYVDVASETELTEYNVNTYAFLKNTNDVYGVDMSCSVDYVMLIAGKTKIASLKVV